MTIDLSKCCECECKKEWKGTCRKTKPNQTKSEHKSSQGLQFFRVWSKFPLRLPKRGINSNRFVALDKGTR